MTLSVAKEPSMSTTKGYKTGSLLLEPPHSGSLLSPASHYFCLVGKSHLGNKERSAHRQGKDGYSLLEFPFHRKKLSVFREPQLDHLEVNVSSEWGGIDGSTLHSVTPIITLPTELLKTK
jgi:hypothetical protein